MDNEGKRKIVFSLGVNKASKKQVDRTKKIVESDVMMECKNKLRIQLQEVHRLTTFSFTFNYILLSYIIKQQ